MKKILYSVLLFLCMREGKALPGSFDFKDLHSISNKAVEYTMKYFYWQRKVVCLFQLQ